MYIIAIPVYRKIKIGNYMCKKIFRTSSLAHLVRNADAWLAKEYKQTTKKTNSGGNFKFSWSKLKQNFFLLNDYLVYVRLDICAK